MLKFQNPFFVTPDAAAAALHGPTVKAWLQGQPGNKVITLLELRAGLPAIAAQLTRPVVNQICADLGADVINADDQAA